MSNSSTNGNYQDGEHVVCIRGHIFHYEDLDKNGLDYGCPECFALIEGGQVVAAKRGENEIDEGYLHTGNDL